MEHIDLQYKEASPAKTVERIRSILNNLGIETQEEINDSGIENCQSLSVTTPLSGLFRSNGKGVSKDLARASAYGEFIERLQCGLNLYKYQSIGRDPEMILHTFAPDAKYMSVAELIETGEWMDYVIQSYPNLTKKTLAEHCKAYACTDEDKILTLPYYSLFEDKYVYLPAGYVEYMYTANGCCVGNTREEAWIHAISEIFERKSNISAILGAKNIPIIDEKVLEKFPTVCKILETIRNESACDVQFFDFSMGNGYPVVAARLIDRKTHRYIVNVGADPILEIALERTLTELFQGRKLRNFNASRSSFQELEKNIPAKHNVLNHLQTGDGAFPLSFFTEEMNNTPPCASFPDYRGLTNQEILPKVLEACKKLDRPLYIRNCSFLGFPCYKIVIPGFSETRALSFEDRIPEYALGDIAARVMRNIEAAADDDIQVLLMYLQRINTMKNVCTRFDRMTGLPISSAQSKTLLNLTLSYAYWKTGRIDHAISRLENAAGLSENEHDAQYYSCLALYLKLQKAGISDEQIQAVFNKFFDPRYPAELFDLLKNGRSPYENHLLKCKINNCASCRYNQDCTYSSGKQLIAKLGAEYKKFTHGQDREQFQI